MVKQKTRFEIDFMGKRRLTSLISGLLIIVSITSLSLQGLNLGIDFTGGTLIEVAYPHAADVVKVRESLRSSDYNDSVVQYFGTANDVLIRIPPREGLNSAAISNDVLKLLPQDDGVPEMRRVEFVGPQVGEELRDDGGLAMIYALIGIFIYVALRFQRRFSIGAIVALVHDVTITMGFFSVFRMDFDLTVLAAVLAVIGYSLNDTIVVFDRVRENFRKLRDTAPIQVFNVSINQTLSRTLMTSFTTVLVLIALFVFGGEIIHSFATALIVGIVVGTYSSIYVASPITLALGVTKDDLMPVQKEGADIDTMP